MGTLKEMLITFIISMMPVAELRAAIPYALSQGISWPVALPVAIAGNMLPVPFILLFLRRIFALMLKFRLTVPIVRWMEKRAYAKSDKVVKYAMVGLLILVALPLPGTGAWTGSLVASVLDLRIKNAVPMIFLGVVIAGIAVTALSLGAIHVFGL